MSRTIMISDIHGCLEPFERLLEKVRYAPEQDRLILLGDYVDKGPQSREVVEAVMGLVKRHGAIALRGNHDQRLVDLIRGNDPVVLHKFAEHGGPPTLQSYTGFSEVTERSREEVRRIMEEQYASHLDFLAGLPLYLEDDRHIYVHAGLRPGMSDWTLQSEHDFMYIKDEFYLHPTTVDKTVIFGHTITTKLHAKADVWFAGDKIGIDGGCSIGLQLNALLFEDGVYETACVENKKAKE
ncbi:serine/threonine protein phosphatase [Paenibacillus sp. 1011MAR3C5]|uniref:metallophosphoesterase family protein n=1 Tax=Paenibacillus sp. 1011MAR3C5 TaxID=1675787 RepID=UPI000E6BBE66|nr:metallophosphoesterase family protein [Paenibacillus sp. 1011MAR3C5]RJE90298.1 serine/threonine protein phosphatase [Paenibacillus sp. 1011MAR3C5]